jgi:uncharacterized membrane protein
MTANAAFAAALTTFLVVAWLAGELTFLAPFKTVLFHRHGFVITGGILLLFLNLCAMYYSIARWLFLRDAGHKLRHVDEQLRTTDGLHDDLRPHLLSMKP